MLSDDELKTLLRSGDWSQLEIEARNVAGVRTSKAAELYLLRALLEQGKMEKLGEALPAALQRRPRATLRFLGAEKERIPQLYRRFADNSVFSDLTSDPPEELVSTRMRWPSFDVLEDRDRVVAFLFDDVFAHAGSGLRGLPKEQVNVLTFGSCFAQNLHNRLVARDVRASTLSLEEHVNTTFANRDILRFLHDGQTNATTTAILGRQEEVSAERDKLLRFLCEATHVVLTVGVAAAFFSTSGEYALISNAKELVRTQWDLVWRMSTVEENKANLLEAVTLIREMNPSASIFMTLSPVPLSTSFSPAGVLYDDLLSKATLRIAIQELMSSQIERVHYWPSFEVVKWLGAHANWAAFGEDDRMSRHPSHWLVDVIVEAFCKRIIADETTPIAEIDPKGLAV